MLYSILSINFFFYLYRLLYSFLQSYVHFDGVGVGVGVNLVKGTLVHVCLLAHLSMKIFYDIKENLFKWLFFKEENLCLILKSRGMISFYQHFFFFLSFSIAY